MPRIYPGFGPDPGHPGYIRGIRGKSHFEPPRQEEGFQLFDFLLIRTAALTVARQRLQVDFLHKYGVKNRS